MENVVVDSPCEKLADFALSMLEFNFSLGPFPLQGLLDRGIYLDDVLRDPLCVFNER